jgi:hypothetical protein
MALKTSWRARWCYARKRPQKKRWSKYGKESETTRMTKDDVRELKTLVRQKTPVAKIAKSLKRTPGATQQKAFTLGVSLDTRD